MLLHLEFQSQRDRDMSGRMFAYALETTPSLRDLEICGLVVNTGLRPFEPWWVPVQTVAGSYRYGFREGLLLDVHAFRVPGLPGGEHPLPADNLVSGVMALARLQAEMKLGASGGGGLGAAGAAGVAPAGPGLDADTAEGPRGLVQDGFRGVAGRPAGLAWGVG